MLALTWLAAGCTPADPDDAPQVETHTRSGCGPLTPARVAGPVPAYVEGGVDRFPNDHAACAATWLGVARTGFVAQGVAVRGHAAWVSGFDGDGREGHLWCTVVRTDLRTGIAQDRRVLRDVPLPEGTRSCRHAGGITVDDHGLWLVEAARLWLLDPETLDVEHSWSLQGGVRGSFAVVDDDGRLGVGAYRSARRGWLDWLDPDALVAGSATVIDERDVLDHVVGPSHAQGVFWGRLGSRQPGLWWARSNTRCGVLVGASGRRGFVPGAEGMAPAGRDGMWVVSESGSRRYQEAGGRPVVPTLVRLDVADVRSWQRPECSI
ncbi:hypothetical protein GCM10009795_048150 [Nocardioides hankookensis]|uniref:Uncharacterized protein n=1 Tax=Nocardioides hankookensis TaxID=443157 RepID=A0ABW1LFU4_9ACTN